MTGKPRRFEPQQRDLSELQARVNRLTEIAEISDKTRTARRQKIDEYEQWCELNELIAFPAETNTVALFIVDLSCWYQPGTLMHWSTAITSEHLDRGFSDPSPLARRLIKGLRRAKTDLAPSAGRNLEHSERQLVALLDGIRVLVSAAMRI